MPPAAAIAVPAALGVLGGVSQARQQRKYAEEAGKPRPYHSTTTQGPPAWLLPFIQGGMQAAQDNYALLRDNPRLPPTFADITSGRYGSPLPTSALGGVQLANVSPRVERAWAANAAKQDRELTDRELMLYGMKTGHGKVGASIGTSGDFADQFHADMMAFWSETLA